MAARLDLRLRLASRMAPPRSPMASAALSSRFTSTCWIWFASAGTGGRSSARSRLRATWRERELVHDHGDRPPRHVVEVGGLAARRRLAREVEQAAHDLAAALGLAHDDLEVGAPLGVVLGALQQERRVGEHAGERVVDLVRHAGGEAADRGELVGLRELALRLGEACGHVVEGPRQVAELVAPVRRDRRREIARGDAPRAGCEGLHRADDEPLAEPPEQAAGDATAATARPTMRSAARRRSGGRRRPATRSRRARRARLVGAVGVAGRARTAGSLWIGFMMPSTRWPSARAIDARPLLYGGFSSGWPCAWQA